MARFLFASIPVPAHTSNPLPIAARLVERGHDVDWYAGAAFHDRIAATGARPVPYRDAHDFSGGDLFDHFPQYAGRSGPRVIGDVFAEIFVGHAPQRVADLRRVLAEAPVDAMLCDALMYGVGMVSELDGPPWATFGDGPLGYDEPDTPPFGPGLLPMRGPVGRLRNRAVAAAARRFLFRDAQRVYDRVRADLGLPPGGDALDASFSPYLHLQASTPAFEYPRTSLPAHVHWIGALRPDPVPWEEPEWWAEVTASPRPVVHVTQGSLRADMTELVVPALRALADDDVLVVVTSGGASPGDVAAAYGGPLPANVRVTPFVPYDELLPHAAVFVTNGGWSGLTVALHHGVPIVQAGTTEEKAENGARVQWSGVGLRLGTTRPSPKAVRDAVRRVLRQPAFAAAAGRVRDEMVTHDAARESADLLERLARTRRPVAGPPGREGRSPERVNPKSSVTG
jgi:UDP:flavonoid glycosyltransferase YjiC (YdhE family)